MKLKSVISRYINALILIPSFLLLALVLTKLVVNFNEYQHSSEAVEMLTLADKASKLVHQLQVERGLTAGFLGSKGQRFKAEINEQRILVNESFKDYLSFIDAHPNDIETSLKRNVDQVITQLNSLDATRRKIDQFDIELQDALQYYTANNLLLINQPLAITGFVNAKSMVRSLLAFYNLMNIKEKSGIERAVVTNILSTKSWTEASKKQLYTLIAEQNVYIDALGKTSPAKGNWQQRFELFVNSSENKQLLSLRAALIDKAIANQFELDPSIWFAAATQRILQLKDLEEQSLTEMHDIEQQINTSALTQMFLWVSILALVSLLTFLVFSTVQLMGQQARVIRLQVNKVIKEQDLTLQIPILSQDSLGGAAMLFNELLVAFRADYDNIAALANKAMAATNDSMVVALQSEQNIKTQFGATTSASAAVEELSVSISDVSKQISNSAKLVAATSLDCKNGHVIVDNVLQSIQGVADEVVSLGNVIDALNTGVGNISKVLIVIQSVADQTNLLALNAAIEAARAGEQGRGFAVVADEVRALAKRVHTSTVEIASIIDSLQMDSKLAVSGIEKGKDKSTAAVTLSQTIGEVLSKIVVDMKNVELNSNAISTNASQQSEVIQEVSLSVANIDEMSRQNMTGAREIAKSTEQLVKVNTQLIKLIRLYKTS
jgi:methyl-accepting chemotaxis protein